VWPPRGPAHEWPRPHLVDLSDVDYVYITHHHWDHFHGPTLRRLPATATILLPKAPTRHMLDDMRERLAETLGIDVGTVSVKAKTTEGMGYTGDGTGIAAFAVAIVETR